MSKKIEVGAVFYYNELKECRIVNVFSDASNMVVVYKFWNERRQEWIYKADNKWSLEEELRSGKCSWSKS